MTNPLLSQQALSEKVNRGIVFPGSFDPVTLGHVSLIRRILPRFEFLHIVVANDINKKSFFNLDKRCFLIQKALEDVRILSSRIKIVKWEGLLVDYCRRHNIFSILRGLRGQDDFQFEKVMAIVNQKLDTQIETFFLLAEPAYREISSSVIRELVKVCHNPQQLEKFLTKSVIKALKEIKCCP